MTGPDAPPTLVVAGSGRVGLSLAAAAAAAGPYAHVMVAGRRRTPPDFLAGLGGVAYRAAPPHGVVLPAEGSGAWHLAFCVPDDALEGAAAAWAAALAEAGGPPPAVALHTSGLHPAARLAPLARAGAALASWHPLVALAEPRRDAFRGAAVGVEGDPAGVEAARALSAAVGARTLRVSAEEKAHYHAGAVFASNHLAACLAVALRELRAGLEDDAALADLLPLARSALDELERRTAGDAPLSEAVTGPVARGDVGTVRRHLERLDPETGDLYRGLAAELLRLTGARLPAAARRELEALLEPGG